jgi:hypothetical protein
VYVIFLTQQDGYYQSSAELFDVGIPDIALNILPKTTSRFYSNAKQA